MSWTIDYYKTESGKAPAYDFINRLPLNMRTKAFKELELLEELGTAITMPYSRYIQDGVFELRIRFANNISRVFYFFFTGSKIILTNRFYQENAKNTASGT